MFKRSDESRTDTRAAKFKYHCKECGEPAFSNHQELKASREVDGDSKEVSGLGLGSWRCPVHGHVAVERRKK